MRYFIQRSLILMFGICMCLVMSQPRMCAAATLECGECVSGEYRCEIE